MKEKKKQEALDLKKQDQISRRQAVSKMGLATFSVATMLLLLNQPGKAQDDTINPDDPDTW